VTFSRVSPDVQQALYTPETSGGLLVSLPPDRLAALGARFDEVGQSYWVVGEVVAGTGVEVVA
jgi:selenide,water dikinase